ncbi:MAG TPA: phosphoribosyltransferase family protein [bacterium]|nr:phosphoribosyltransferase family protein [bacterium]
MSEPLRTVFFTESQIHTAVEQISRSVLAWLRENKTKILNLVSILEGARPLTRDMAACLQQIAPDIRIKIYEIRVQGTDGHQNLLADREVQEGSLDFEVICQHSVLVVDDLVDSGLTLKKLKDELLAKGVEDVRTAVLIRKFGTAGGPVDFLGFDLNWNHQALAQKGYKDCWLYGYGMDLDGKYRDLHQVEGVYLPER